MKKFLTLCLALGCTALAYAQFPDKSNWQDGQDVSAELSWGDYDGTWSSGYETKSGAVTSTPNQSPFWQGTQPNEMALDDANGEYPALGFYTDGAKVADLADMYQVIALPAGYYKVTVNAVYREGTPADTWTSYVAGNPKRNAHLYVNTLNSENADDVNVTYDKPINSLPFSNVTELQFTGADSGTSWKTDGSYTIKGGAEDGSDLVVYYPNCDEGAAMHFALGNYLHELKFILLEDGYIRLGLKKTANIAQDWLIWSNFHIYYESDADESAQIDLAYDTYVAAATEIEDLQERIADGGYLALNDMLGDDFLTITGDLDDTDLASINATTQALIDLRAKYEAAFNAAKSIGELIDMSEDMSVATDFPGKAAFDSAIEAAKDVAFAGSAADIDYEPAAYTEAFNALSAARAAYLDSQDFDEDGNKDFTMLIKNPWFVNAEYTPTQKEDGSWSLDEETWADRSVLGNPGNYSDKLKMDDGTFRTDIASDVVLSADTEATNTWFKYVNFSGWSPGLQLYYQSSLIGPSAGWNSIDGGSEEICQQLVGLPEGYYSLRALMRGSGGMAWTDGGVHNIYAKNSNGDEVKSPADATESDANNNMSNNWYEWNPLAWKEHRTGIIQVPDGKLLIAAQSTQVMNATGFRLFFHGESPEFDKMIQSDIDEATAKAEALAFAGDKKYCQDLLAQIQLPIGTDAVLYEANMALLDQVNDYVKTANATLAGYTAVEDFLALQGNYDAASDQYAMLQIPVNYVMALGENEADTYEDAQAASKDYTAFASYMKVFDQSVLYPSQEVATVAADHVAYLKANYADAAKLAELESELHKPVVDAIMAKLQSEQGEATPENPVDITALLVNPKFESDVKGWAGTAPSQNEYARSNAEIWNQTSFDMYQILKDLPQGTYQIKAQALYRDGAGSADLAKCYDSWQAAGGDKEAWANHNAVIYAKGGKRQGTGYITSVCDTKLTANSFEKYYANESSYPEVGTGTGKFLFFDELHEDDLPYAEDYLGAEYFYSTADSTAEAFQYPFDGRVDLEDGTSLFFPESMAGAALRFAQGEYPCEAEVVLPEGENLQVGISKSAGVSGDWVIFTNFQLFYLGPVNEELNPEPNPAPNLVDDDSYNFNNAICSTEDVWGNTQYHIGGWAMTWNNNGGKASINVEAPGYNKSAQCMTLTNPEASTGNVYDAQVEYALQNDVTLEPGKTYYVNFFAKADEDGTEFQVSAESPWDANVAKWQFNQFVTLTKDWKEYTIEVFVKDTPDAGEEDLAFEPLTAVKINFGFMVGKAYVDRFLVYDSREEINPEDNLIVDDASFAFNDGTTGGWKMQGWNNQGTATAVENGWNGSAYCMELAPNGSAKQNYEAQLPYNLVEAMEVGKTYNLSFYAKAENEGAEIEFGAQLSPWAASNKEWNGNMFALTTEWAKYSIEFTVTDDFPADGLNCLYINYGMTNGKAYIDHIVLVETIPAEVNPADNMIADDASFGFEDGTTGQWNYLGWNNQGTRANAAPGYGSEGCMVLTSTNSAGDPWGAQLLCPLKTPVMRGGEYEITFFAKADEEGDFINPGIAKAYPEPEWNSAPNAVLTTEWQKFTYTLVADENNTAEDGNSNFYFNHGKLTGNAYVDRVVVICTKQPADAINNVTVKNAPAVRVNLAGQAVGESFKGIVIENGKKVLVK